MYTLYHNYKQYINLGSIFLTTQKKGLIVKIRVFFTEINYFIPRGILRIPDSVTRILYGLDLEL